jgi:hypothetical protein
VTTPALPGKPFEPSDGRADKRHDADQFAAALQRVRGGSGNGRGDRRRVGPAAWRQRAEQSRQLAEYTLNKLRDLGWPAWRNPHAFTVMMQTPAPQVAQRWMLAHDGEGWSHIVCAPGIARDHIDRFLTELAAAERLSPSGPSRSQSQ